MSYYPVDENGNPISTGVSIDDATNAMVNLTNAVSATGNSVQGLAASFVDPVTGRSRWGVQQEELAAREREYERVRNIGIEALRNPFGERQPTLREAWRD